MINKFQIKYIILGVLACIAVIVVIVTYIIKENNDNSSIKQDDLLRSQSEQSPNIASNQLQINVGESTEEDSESNVVLVKTSLLSDLISIDLPDDFVIMPDDIADIKYPTNKPTLIYTNEDTTINVAFNHTDQAVLEQEMAWTKLNMTQELISLVSNAEWIKDDIININGKIVGIIEFITPALDTDIYNLMFMLELDGRLLLGTINIVKEMMDEWQSIAHDIVQSLEVSIPIDYHLGDQAPLTTKDLSFIKTDTGETISIGMSKEELNEILGPSTEFILNEVIRDDYNDLHAYFRNNMLVYMKFSLDFDSGLSYMTSRNVQLAFPIEMAFQIYGEPTSQLGDYYVTYTYVLMLRDEKLVVLEEHQIKDVIENGDVIYFMDLGTVERNGITLISDIHIADQEFAYTMR